MKNAVIILTTLCIAAGCRTPEEKKATPVVRLVPAPRDASISLTNAYNDLFLDSGAAEQFIRQKQLSDSLANDLRSFYNVRNYEFAWFDRNGLTEQALAFNSLYDYRLDTVPSEPLDDRLSAFMSEDSLRITGKSATTIKTELELTVRFIHYIAQSFPSLNMRRQALLHFIPVKKSEVLALAKTALEDRKDEPGTSNTSYTALKQPLKQYVAIQEKGGWPVLPAGNLYKKGGPANAIAALKKRLQLTGELRDADTSGSYTAELDSAVRTFQANHGHQPDGKVTATIVKEMNIPTIARIQQLLLNMERMRWVPAEDDRRLAIVNIPEFMLHVWEGNQKVFDMAVVVGKEGHSTTLFSGKLNEVVFSPYWNVPPSIVRKEILPGIRRNKNYLAANQMEINGQEDGLPKVRQLPGGKNSLGKVKFLFPNSFNIYFHDTPAKELFNRDVRAYSHGCIRLHDPAKMAAYVLQGMPGWTPGKIDSAMNAGKERFVRVKNPLPVLITYYTAWVDENQVLHFVPDIYGHDEKLGNKLFADPQELAQL